MKILLIQVGKTTDSYIKEGILVYEKRLTKYNPFETITLPEIKSAGSLSIEQQKNLEGKSILEAIPANSYIILLDERGTSYSSQEFAEFIQKQLLKSIKYLIFVIGGPYGFSEQVYQKADNKIALSQMTFSHQMVRLFFTEQIYRAFTILKNEPYHH